jgi:hypothetical protein
MLHFRRIDCGAMAVTVSVALSETSQNLNESAHSLLQCLATRLWQSFASPGECAANLP